MWDDADGDERALGRDHHSKDCSPSWTAQEVWFNFFTEIALPHSSFSPTPSSFSPVWAPAENPAPHWAGTKAACDRREHRSELPGQGERWESSGLRVAPFPFVRGEKEKTSKKGICCQRSLGKGQWAPKARGIGIFLIREILKIPFPSIFLHQQSSKPAQKMGALPLHPIP